MTIYIVEYVFHDQNGEIRHHINQDGFLNLESAKAWCTRNGAKKVTGMTYHWVENGDSWYLIHPTYVLEGVK